MKKILVFFVAFLSLSLFLSACAGVKVKRTDTDEVIDLSGNWNDADSQIVAESMINECSNLPWREEFLIKNSRKPRVIVGTVKNKSEEHINTETFVKDLERAMTNSGKMTFVADKTQRGEIRDEKADQAEFSNKKTAKPQGEEMGADYMIQGQINTIFDAAGNKAVRYYQVELEMTNILTNEKAWIGQKKIKKLVKNSKYSL